PVPPHIVAPHIVAPHMLFNSPSSSLVSSNAVPENPVNAIRTLSPRDEAREINLGFLEEEHTTLLAKEGVDIVAQEKLDKEYEDMFRCQTCNKSFINIDQLYCHQNELGHLELKQTPRGPGYLCWKKGCNQYFKTALTLQVHFREIHAKKSLPGALSVHDLEAYKFKCGQCSYNFRSLEAMQRHTLIHLMQSVTQCRICSRRVSSVAKMRRHLETVHGDLSLADMTVQMESIEANASLLFSSPAYEQFTVKMLMVNGNASNKLDIAGSEEDIGQGKLTNGLDIKENVNDHDLDDAEVMSDYYREKQFLEDYMNSQSMAEEHFKDVNRKFKCNRCKVAFTNQRYLFAHNKTSQHRQGEQADKFDDPSRPYRCEICKESFTQKNILMVHYNSVSHLHKLKQHNHLNGEGLVYNTTSGSHSTPPPLSPSVNVNSPSTGAPNGGFDGSDSAGGGGSSTTKPYKCNICKVSYNNQPSIEIHLRSVGHKTKASKLGELIQTGQVDVHQALIEHPDPRTAGKQQAQIIADMIHQQATAQAASNATATYFNLQGMQGLNAMAQLSLLQGIIPASSHHMLSASAQNALAAMPRGFMGRFKPQLHRSLLENYGFECVMHFNEEHSMEVESTKEDNKEEEAERMQEKMQESECDESKEDNRDENKENIDLPELGKCKCHTCNKDFSNVWVLKNHEEEVHNHFVSPAFIEDFGKKFKEDWEKNLPKISEHEGVGSLQMPSDPPTPTNVEKAPAVEMPPPPPPAQPQMPTGFDMAQLSQLLPLMGLNMLPMQFPMNLVNLGLSNSMMPSLMMPTMDLSQGFLSQMQPPPLVDASSVSSQQQMQAAAAAAAQNQKRVRTRISDDQLKVLRQYFDINNSPSEEQINKMSDQTGLPQKVIKHWFRNTLFKERQRNKDSPYNFNNPPSTSIDLDEYDRTGKIPEVKQEPEEEEEVGNPLVPENMGKRANRTRFTDYQIKTLQDYFERNAYPKDDELEHLSKILGLSARVIVVWFQNARQKARKIYENQPTAENPKEIASPFQRTPGLNYQCKKCNSVFQRYYELIKHQKNSCVGESNNNNNKSIHSMMEDDSNFSYSNDDSNFSDRQGTPAAAIREREVLSRSQQDIVSPPSSTTVKPPSATSSSACIPQSPVVTSAPSSASSLPTFKCDKCSMTFSRFDVWQEHQKSHSIAPAMYTPFSSSSAFGMLQTLAHQEDSKAALSLARKTDSEDESGEQPRDKRLRTTILPEQLDYLYQQYQIDCNPSRKQLEHIASTVNLKKRVVQVWFQNTRARERKGHYRAHQQLINKRCPFCRALFRAKSALESHLATKHPEEMAKGDINIDLIPDAMIEPPTGLGHSSLSLSSGHGTSHSDISKLLPPGAAATMPNYMAFMSSAGALNLPFPSPTPEMLGHPSFEDPFFKKYMSELASSMSARQEHNAARQEHNAPHSSHNIHDDAPLDLSKPVKSLTTSHSESSSRISTQDFNERAMELEYLRRLNSLDDSFSETQSEMADNEYMNDVGGSPPSPSHTSNGSLHLGGHTPGSSGKRYRTQMSATQVKVMKHLFQDYKTPTMAECELLGQEIGLAKRVVQVWFQNARAKEKKAKLNSGKPFNAELDFPKSPEDCKLCNYKYSHKVTV
ncbi:unnamed protein product, partial [Lymnaea stagnalis]